MLQRGGEGNGLIMEGSHHRHNKRQCRSSVRREEDRGDTGGGWVVTPDGASGLYERMGCCERGCKKIGLVNLRDCTYGSVNRVPQFVSPLSGVVAAPTPHLYALID